jgi:hypothetical protein
MLASVGLMNPAVFDSFPSDWLFLLFCVFPDLDLCLPLLRLESYPLMQLATLLFRVSQMGDTALASWVVQRRLGSIVSLAQFTSSPLTLRADALPHAPCFARVPGAPDSV